MFILIPVGQLQTVVIECDLVKSTVQNLQVVEHQTPYSQKQARHDLLYAGRGRQPIQTVTISAIDIALHACSRCYAPEAMTEEPIFYNLEEVEELARRVLPKAVSMHCTALAKFLMTNTAHMI